MILLVPLVFVMIGLCFGGGLLYASRRVQSRLQAIEDAKPCKAGSPVEGMVKIHGTVRAVNPDELLTSPIEQQPCVYYRLVIEHFQQSASVSSGPRRTVVGGSWVPLIEDVQAIPMVIADETGSIAIDAQEAQLDFQQNRRHANLFASLPKEIEESLRERYKMVTKTWFIPKQMRYTEVVITQDAEVFAVGECEVRDGQASLVKKDQPLMMTFRNEQQVLRNGRITVTIMKVLAVVFPILFVLMAAGVWWDLSGRHRSSPTDPAKVAQQNATNDAIHKIKTTGSSSERASAARKLADLPVQKDRVAEVAPRMNLLLDSNQKSQRDAAILAIKQGWGSATNQPALLRILEGTSDSAYKREVTAALNRTGAVN